MLTTLKLLTTAGLGAGYLAVAFLAAHPHVDSEYDAHYLHRTSNCWIPTAMRVNAPMPPPPALVEIGQLSHPESCRYMRLGWWDLEGWGAWSNGDKATLELPRKPGARAVELVLRGAPAPAPATHVRFRLDGRTTEDDIPPGTTTTVTFPLPPEGDAYDPLMRLTFDRYALVPNPEASKPGEAKMRHVGVGLVAIRYLPAVPGTNAGVFGRAF